MKEGQIKRNSAQLVEDNVYYIVPASKYDIRNDERLLIPFMRNHKIGFVNQQAVPLVEPKYDIVHGDIFEKTDYVLVGVRYSYGYPRPGNRAQTYERYKWGLLDSYGNNVIKCDYASISISDDYTLFTLKNYDKGYCVVDRNSNVIVPYGDYSIIDGFTDGYARVKKDNKWGIIDKQGKVALSVEYDNIWFFHKKTHYGFTRVSKKGIGVFRFDFMTGKLTDFNLEKYHQYEKEDAFSSHYGEYAGTYAQDVAGYSDDVINDAFDGEPDAYWNID